MQWLMHIMHDHAGTNTNLAVTGSLLCYIALPRNVKIEVRPSELMSQLSRECRNKVALAVERGPAAAH